MEKLILKAIYKQFLGSKDSFMLYKVKCKMDCSSSEKDEREVNDLTSDSGWWDSVVWQGWERSVREV